MEFDREALRGICGALSGEEKNLIAGLCGKARIRMNNGQVIDEDLWRVTKILVELGYIIPFEVSQTELAAQEYEEAMLAQDLMGG
jgi:hypothetical protein